MGSFNNQVLGDLGGKVGNIVGRRRKGKFFVYAMPTEVKISNSPEAIKSRNIMAPLAKFASIVNSIPELKYLWTNSKIEAFDAFHKIEKVNFPFLIPERPNINNTIIPDIFADNKIKESSISPKGIKLKISISKLEEEQLEGAKELTGIGVICYFNPNGGKLDYFHLSKIRTTPIEVKIDEQFEVDIVFNEEERSNYNSYLNSILYFTIVSKDINGAPLKFFYNYRNEFTHENIGEKERFSFRDSRP
ncbi:hypothetical protein [Clostridium sp.]|uniref:hypothetical protein n=1 Tax=Clostridium sp. TaxID=1506 RepID=UPI00283CB975|nr:hypothetical protein [Clostridium sp.]MDR3598841.1 hypothetical protein [Clostridium sp.]